MLLASTFHTAAGWACRLLAVPCGFAHHPPLMSTGTAGAWFVGCILQSTHHAETSDLGDTVGNRDDAITQAVGIGRAVHDNHSSSITSLHRVSVSKSSLIHDRVRRRMTSLSLGILPCSHCAHCLADQSGRSVLTSLMSIRAVLFLFFDIYHYSLDRTLGRRSAAPPLIGEQLTHRLACLLRHTICIVLVFGVPSVKWLEFTHNLLSQTECKTHNPSGMGPLVSIQATRWADMTFPSSLNWP